MPSYSLVHLSDGALLRDLAALVAKDRATTAELLAHIAEVDARKLYVPAAYQTMFAYCVGELHLSEDAAAKRIHAARAARRFPAVFDAIAKGRLHLSAVVLLAPHLTEDNAADLLAAAVHKSKSEIERLLAERFPRPDVLAWVTQIPAPSSTPPVSHAPGHAEMPRPQGADTPLAPEPVPDSHAPGHVNVQTSPQTPGNPVTVMNPHAHVDRSRVSPSQRSRTLFSSRSASAATTCCATRRNCSATRFRPEISGGFSSGRWKHSSHSSRRPSSPRQRRLASAGLARPGAHATFRRM